MKVSCKDGNGFCGLGQTQTQCFFGPEIEDGNVKVKHSMELKDELLSAELQFVVYIRAHDYLKT
jgi:hypothetical protein